HEVVVLSRSSGVDVLDGTGLDAHLEGVDAVIDALNTSSLSLRKATEFFRATTRNLLDAEERQDVDHHVTLSIVGIDGIAVSYYGAKLAQEDEARRSAVPHTIARATQLHEFAAQLAERTPLGPVSLIPRLLCPPVAPRSGSTWIITSRARSWASTGSQSRTPARGSRRRMRRAAPPPRTRSRAPPSSTSSQGSSLSAPRWARSRSSPACCAGRSRRGRSANTSWSSRRESPPAGHPTSSAPRRTQRPRCCASSLITTAPHGACSR